MTELDKRFAQFQRHKEMKVIADTLFDVLKDMLPLLVQREVKAMVQVIVADEVKAQLEHGVVRSVDVPVTAATLKAMSERHGAEMRARGLPEPGDHGRMAVMRTVTPQVRVQQEKIRRVMAEVRKREAQCK